MTCLSPSIGILGMCQHGRRFAAHNRRCLTNQIVVGERLYHKEGEIHAPCQIAGEYGIPDVSAPHGKTLAFAFFQVAPANNSPLRAAGEYPIARLYLIVQISDAQKAGNPAKDFHKNPELPWIDILTVSCDVPSTGEDKTSAWVCIVKHGLRRSSCVLLNAPWYENRKHAITSCNSFPDHGAVVRCPRVHRDLLAEIAEFADALFPTDSDNFIASI